MDTLELSISLSPTSNSTPSFDIAITVSEDGATTPTGTLSVWVNGIELSVGSTPISASYTYSIGIGLDSATPPGAYNVQVKYSGDSNWNPAESNVAVFTRTGTSTPVSPASQALAAPAYAAVATADRTRTQIENGEPADVVYNVSAINLLQKGRGYDSNSVATLTQGSTRETLTIALDDDGGITGLTGFNSSTAWTAPPKVTITRWTADGVFIPG